MGVVLDPFLFSVKRICDGFMLNKEKASGDRPPGMAEGSLAFVYNYWEGSWIPWTRV